MNIKVEATIQAQFEKRELTLITKALVGKLRPEEVQEAKELGWKMLSYFAEELKAKHEAAAHAQIKTSEP